MEQRKQARGRHQHFIGSWARLNCENMPVIPAWLVRSNLDVWRTLPRNGGRALFLFCPHCEMPRRHVYGWEWDSFSGWSGPM